MSWVEIYFKERHEGASMIQEKILEIFNKEYPHLSKEGHPDYQRDAGRQVGADGAVYQGRYLCFCGRPGAGFPC